MGGALEEGDCMSRLRGCKISCTAGVVFLLFFMLIRTEPAFCGKYNNGTISTDDGRAYLKYTVTGIELEAKESGPDYYSGKGPGNNKYWFFYGKNQKNVIRIYGEFKYTVGERYQAEEGAPTLLPWGRMIVIIKGSSHYKTWEWPGDSDFYMYTSKLTFREHDGPPDDTSDRAYDNDGIEWPLSAKEQSPGVYVQSFDISYDNSKKDFRSLHAYILDNNLHPGRVALDVYGSTEKQRSPWINVIGGFAILTFFATGTMATLAATWKLAKDKAKGKKSSREEDNTPDFVYILQRSTDSLQVEMGKPAALQLTTWRVDINGYKIATEASIQIIVPSEAKGLQVSPASGQGQVSCTVSLTDIPSAEKTTLTVISSAGGSRNTASVAVDMKIAYTMEFS